MNKLHLQPPLALQCFGDPGDSHCQPAATPQSHACTSGAACHVIVEGTNLHPSDVLRLATDSTCAVKLPQAGAETFASMAGSMTSKKVFPVGTITGSVTAHVCYCDSQNVAQGCSTTAVAGLDFAFAARGTLLVS